MPPAAEYRYRPSPSVGQTSVSAVGSTPSTASIDTQTASEAQVWTQKQSSFAPRNVPILRPSIPWTNNPSVKPSILWTIRVLRGSRVGETPNELPPGRCEIIYVVD